MSIVFILLAIGSGAWSFHHYKKLEALKRYAFENRTSGGVVEFKTYEDSKRHASQMHWYPKRIQGGLIMCALFLIFAMTA